MKNHTRHPQRNIPEFAQEAPQACQKETNVPGRVKVSKPAARRAWNGYWNGYWNGLS